MSSSDNVSQRAAGVDNAIDAFRRGKPVCIHDSADREGETDLVYPAGAVSTDAVTQLRNDAGGLICVAVSDAVADTYDLPFMQDVLDHPAAADHELEYDDRSSFSLTVNHRDTHTGITDEDRSLTIRALARAADTPGAVEFSSMFRSPGHVHVLRAAPNLLSDRQGHTELGLALADAADLPPAVVVCEMLDDETGQALPPAAAQAYAERNDIPYVEGSSLIDRFE
jgi:3,4-dihydroxy 2-butanone 4-phosphate synthase